jgi:PAS domain S-box-containing protein
MAHPLKFLLVEDSLDDAALTLRALEHSGYALDYQRVDTAEAFQRGLDPALDVIICDYSMPTFGALEALRLLKESGLDVPLILVSGTIGEDDAVAAMRAGASDYLLKDRLTRLGPAVEQAREQRLLLASKRQAEHGQRRSQALFRALIENSLDGMVLISPEGGISYASPAAARLLGRGAEALQGTNLLLLLHPDDQPAARQTFGDLRRAPQVTVQVRYRYAWPSGGWRWLEGTGANLLGDPDVQAIVCHFRDISAELQRERELASIAEVSAALRVAQNRAEMPPIVLAQITALLGAAAAGLNLADPASGEVITELGWGEWAELTGLRRGADQGIAGQVLASGQAYHSPDISTDARFYDPARTPRVRAVACAPLKVKERPIGTLTVARPDAFADDELRLLMAVADMAASALHRAALHEQTQQRLQRLTALRMIDIAITASLDLEVTLNVVLDHATRQLNIHAADILLLDEHTQRLDFAAGRGFRSRGLERTRVRLGSDQAGRAALEQRLVSVPNLQAEGVEFSRREALRADQFTAYVGVPLLAKGQLRGVFEIFHRDALALEPEWVEFLETLAGRAAIAIDNATLFADLQRSHAELSLAYDRTLEGWARALDERAREAPGHSQRVADLSVQLGQALGLAAEELLHLRRGALLHDLGMLRVPEALCHKPGPLSADERALVAQHPAYAVEQLRGVGYLRRALEGVAAHHERWDGSGYPLGLPSEQIPLAGRLLAVADVWEALRSERAYREAWTDAAARDHLKAQSGKLFDAKVIEAFERVIGK